MLERSPGFNLKPDMPLEDADKRAKRSEAARKGARTRAARQSLHKAVEDAVNEKAVADIYMQAKEKERAAELQSMLAPGIAKALEDSPRTAESEDESVGRLEQAATGVQTEAHKAQRTARLGEKLHTSGAVAGFKAEMARVREGATQDFAAIQEKARAREAAVRETLKNREEEWSDALDREGEKLSKKLDEAGVPEEYMPRHVGMGPRPGYAPHEEAKRKMGLKSRISRAFKAFLKVLGEE